MKLLVPSTVISTLTYSVFIPKHFDEEQCFYCPHLMYEETEAQTGLIT